MPKTHHQPKASPPKGSHTKNQPPAKGSGSPKGHEKDLRSYKSTTGRDPKKY